MRPIILFSALHSYFLNISIVLSLSPSKSTIEQFYITTYKDFRRQQSLQQLPWFQKCLQTAVLSDQQSCLEQEIKKMQPGHQKQMLIQLGQAPLELRPGEYHEQLKNHLKKLFYDSLLGNTGQPSESFQKKILLNQEYFQIALERVLTRQLFFDLAQFCQQELSTNLSVNAAQQCLEKIKKPCIFQPPPASKTKNTAEYSTCLIRKKFVQLQKVLLALKEQQTFWTQLKQEAKKTPILKLSQQLLEKELPTHFFNQLTSAEMINKNLTSKRQKNDLTQNQEYALQLEKRLGDQLLREQTLLDLKIQSLSAATGLSPQAVKQMAETTGLYSEEEMKELSNKSPEDIKKDLELRLQAEKQAIVAQINEKINQIKQKPNPEELTKQQRENQKITVILANYLQAAIGTIQSSSVDGLVGNQSKEQQNKIRSDRAAFDREILAMEAELKASNLGTTGVQLEQYQKAFKFLEPQLSGVSSANGRSYASSQAQELLTINTKAIDELLGTSPAQ